MRKRKGREGGEKGKKGKMNIEKNMGERTWAIELCPEQYHASIALRLRMLRASECSLYAQGFRPCSEPQTMLTTIAQTMQLRQCLHGDDL